MYNILVISMEWTNKDLLHKLYSPKWKEMNQYTHTLPGHSEGCSFSWGIFTVKSQNIEQGRRASFVLQELPLTFIIPILHTRKSTCDKLAFSHDSWGHYKMHVTYFWSRKTSNQCFVDNIKWDSATYGHSLLQANGQNTIRLGTSSFRNIKFQHQRL